MAPKPGAISGRTPNTTVTSTRLLRAASPTNRSCTIANDNTEHAPAATPCAKRAVTIPMPDDATAQAMPAIT